MCLVSSVSTHVVSLRLPCTVCVVFSTHTSRDQRIAAKYFIPALRLLKEILDQQSKSPFAVLTEFFPTNIKLGRIVSLVSK